MQEEVSHVSKHARYEGKRLYLAIMMESDKKNTMEEKEPVTL